jgi:hypothetical protein
MEYPYTHRDEDFPIIGEVLDVVKTARYQFGTLSHMSEDLEHSVSGLRTWLEEVQRFFSDRRNITYTAASIIATAALLNYMRGWSSVRDQPLTFVNGLAKLMGSIRR